MVPVLTIIAIGFAVVVAGLLIFIVTRPDSFRLERSAVIAAPAGDVFSLVNDFHQWEKWSPWEHLDPNMKKTFEGPAKGPGAIYSWSGNSKAGAGRMTLLTSAVDKEVSIELAFFKPMKCTNLAKFVFTPGGSGTKVDWIMTGNNNFMGKMFYPFMDKAVGGDFEKGLANLDRVASGRG
jgi:hypothetical protein